MIGRKKRPRQRHTYLSVAGDTFLVRGFAPEVRVTLQEATDRDVPARFKLGDGGDVWINPHLVGALYAYGLTDEDLRQGDSA